MTLLLFQSDVAAIGIIVLLLFGGTLYFVPTIIAMARGHHNALAIGLLNLFLGWTFLGWVAALVWSVTATYSRPQLYHQQYPQQQFQPAPQRVAKRLPQPEVSGGGFQEWLSSGNNTLKFGGAILGFILIIAGGFFLSGSNGSKQNLNSQAIVSTSPSESNVYLKLTKDLNDRFSGRVDNVYFYKLGGNPDTINVSGAGLNEKVIKDIQRDKYVIERLRSHDIKYFLFKTPKQDMKVEISK